MQLNLVPVCDGLHWEKWSDAQLVEFQQSIELIDLLEGASLAFRGERNLVNMWFEQLYDGTEKLAGTGTEEFDPGFFMGLNRYHINRIITENLLAKIDVENHRVSMRDTPTAEEEIEKLTNAPFAFRYAFTAMLIPAYDKIILNMTSAQAGLDQAKIVAALERYRLAKGNYPPTLAELVPAYLAKLPGDMFHDRGLVYRPDGDSFTLYSTGFNVEDDGGEFVLSHGKDISIEFDKGDWPWPSVTAE